MNIRKTYLVIVSILVVAFTCVSCASVFDRVVDNQAAKLENRLYNTVDKSIDGALDSAEQRMLNSLMPKVEEKANAAAGWLESNVKVYENEIVIPAWLKDVPKPTMGNPVGTIEMPYFVTFAIDGAQKGDASSYAKKLQSAGFVDMDYDMLAKESGGSELEYGFYGVREDGAVVVGYEDGEIAIVFYQDAEMVTVPQL
ncbi:MAG: hypothetical protein SPD11_05095 [Sphaerochaetaceae bacterium]|nr:hypothetical protein [Sphaerochaetaceae bacterium]